MYYFARVNSINVVVETVSISQEESSNYLGNFSEVISVENCVKKFGFNEGDRWIQTSKDGSIRRKYAGKNDIYDEENDRFLPPQPHGAWVFNEETYCYDAPYPQPELTYEQRNEGFYYVWEDNEYLLDNTKGWILKKVGEL
jgi:hypothetical protein